MPRSVPAPAPAREAVEGLTVQQVLADVLECQLLLLGWAVHVSGKRRYDVPALHDEITSIGARLAEALAVLRPQATDQGEGKGGT